MGAFLKLGRTFKKSDFFEEAAFKTLFNYFRPIEANIKLESNPDEDSQEVETFEDSFMVDVKAEN